MIRGAFEYQGQKCSAASRAYVPDTLWKQVREKMLAEIATQAPTIRVLIGSQSSALHDLRPSALVLLDLDVERGRRHKNEKPSRLARSGFG